MGGRRQAGDRKANEARGMEIQNLRIQHQNAKIKGLVFDAYGTLFDINSLTAECEVIFPGHGRTLSELWRSKQLQYTWLRSLMVDYLDFWQVTGDALEFACRASGLTCSDAALEHLLDQYLTLDTFTEVPEALRVLHKSYKLAILSNGTARMLEMVAQGARVRDEFDSILSVDSVRVYKPDPRAYEIATRVLKLQRSEIGFVSSNPFDVVGGKRFGFYSIWLQRNPVPFEVLGVEPDLEIKHLTELVEKA